MCVNLLLTESGQTKLPQVLSVISCIILIVCLVPLAHRRLSKRLRITPFLLFFAQFEGAMALLEESAAVKGLATARPAMKSATTEEAEELDVTPAAAAAKLLEARTPVGAEGGEGGEAEENGAADEEDNNGDGGNSGGVVYVPAPTRLPTPP